MDSFLRSVSGSKTDASDAAADHSSPNQQHPKPSSSELFSNAKVVADAANAKFQKKEFDEAKAAEAAADLLDAASKYGKLEDDKGLGKYVNQAEDYLHKYNAKNTTTGHSTTPTATATPHETAPPSSGGEHEKSGSGGYGDYVKMAEGFLNKKSGDETTPHDGKSSADHSSSEGGHEKKSEGGFGGYMKMAGDFMKKD